ncbi:MAG: transglycosylase SLT domain-containing protein [bacterium]
MPPNAGLDFAGRNFLPLAALAAVAAAGAALAIRLGVTPGAYPAGAGRAPQPEQPSCGRTAFALAGHFVADEAAELIRECGDYDPDEWKKLEGDAAKLNGAAKELSGAYPFDEDPLGGGSKVRAETGFTASARDFHNGRFRSAVDFALALKAFAAGDYGTAAAIADDADGGAPLADYRLHLAALAALRAGDFAKAAAAAESFSSTFPGSLLADDVRVIGAAAAFLGGDERPALDALDLLAVEGRTPAGRGKALMSASDVHARANRFDEALKSLMRIPAMYPDADAGGAFGKRFREVSAKAGFERLDPGAVAKLCRFFLDKREYSKASHYAERALKAHPGSLHLTLAAGEADRATGNLERAKKRFESVLKKADDEEIRRQARLELARTLVKMKNFRDAEREFLRCYGEHVPFRYVPLRELAQMHMRNGSEAAWQAAAKMLVDEFPRLEGNDVALRLLARRAFLDGETRKAEALYGAIAADFPDGANAPEALFWLAEICRRRGDEECGRRHAAEIERRHPYSYFYYRTRGEAGTGGAPFPRESRDYERLARAVSADRRLANGYAFMALGMDVEAEREFTAAALDGGREARVGLAKLHRAGGRLVQSVKSIEEAVTADAAFYRETMGSAVLRELLFPTLYGGAVFAAAAEYGVESAMIYAIVRQESRFDPAALSPSRAMGLMQIIPATGLWSAEKMGLKNFDAGRLYEVPLNVRMGTWYFRRMRGKFGGDVEALAAYNWGPGSLARWMAAHPTGDTDVFIESLPRAETRRYVKNVILNYMVYRELTP